MIMLPSFYFERGWRGWMNFVLYRCLSWNSHDWINKEYFWKRRKNSSTWLISANTLFSTSHIAANSLNTLQWAINRENNMLYVWRIFFHRICYQVIMYYSWRLFFKWKSFSDKIMMRCLYFCESLSCCLDWTKITKIHLRAHRGPIYGIWFRTHFVLNFVKSLI